MANRRAKKIYNLISISRKVYLVSIKVRNILLDNKRGEG